MTVNHDAVAALPTTTAGANKTLLRNLVVARMPYVLADAEDSRNLVATDPSTGAIIVDLLLLGRVFHYDAADTTTAHDGTTCLVSSDGRRYKLALGSDVFAWAVLDNTIATPPGSPALGDAYLVAAGATGAWAGKSGTIAVKTSRGWEFVNFSIGRFVYVESVDSYYHKNSGGTWVSGLGSNVFGAGTVPISAVIGANASFVIKVENQTTNAPPGSPVAPTAYIIGPSPTGAWAGNSGKLAICLVSGSFTIITPVAGDVVYDKAQGVAYQYSGSAWLSSAGVLLKRATGTYGNTSSFSSVIPFDNTIPQISEGLQLISVSYTPRAPNSIIRISFSGMVYASVSQQGVTAAIFKDAIANAVAANALIVPASSVATLTVEHEFQLASATPVTFSVNVGTSGGTITMNGGVIGLYGGTTSRMVIEEYAA